MHLIMASAVLRTFLAKNVHLSKHVLFFHLPKIWNKFLSCETLSMSFNV